MWRAYDIRGIYGEEVNEQKFFRLGKALAELYKTLVVAHDYRYSSTALAKALMSGYGKKITYIGYFPTPGLAFLSKEFDGGVQITASHNPPEYNGAKIFENSFQADLKKIREKYEKILPEPFGEAMFGVDERIKKEYVESIDELPDAIYDLATGAMCSIRDIFPETIFDVADPLFKAHSPEPRDETLEVLKEKTLSEKKMGFAFDGDGDRLVAVLRGEVVRGDILGAFLASWFLPKNERIVAGFDVSDEVLDFLRERFDVYVTHVGTSFIVEKSKEVGAKFSLEQSGHYTYYPWSGHSDPLFLLSRIADATERDLDSFIREFRRELKRRKVKGRKNLSAVENFLEKEGFELEKLDGIKGRKEGITILVRHSNTEPITRIQLEYELEKEEYAMKLVGEIEKLPEM